MSTVSINLSQAVVTTNIAGTAKNGSATVADLFDIYFVAAYNFAVSHPTYASFSGNSSSLRFNFSDGAYKQHFGVTGLNGSGTGTASATSTDMVWPSAYRLSYAGTSNFTYSYPNGNISTDSLPGTITAVTLQTLTPTNSTVYDQTVGNVLLSLKGVLNERSDGTFIGTVSSIANKADKFLDSSSLVGNFNVTANGIQIGQKLATSTVSGTATAYSENYRDGSYLLVSDASIAVTGSSKIDESTLANAANFPGNDNFDVTLPAVLTKAYLMASGAGDDIISLKGGGGRLSAAAGDGMDSVTLRDSGHAVDGGAGYDTLILSQAISKYAISKSGSTYVIREKAIGTTDSATNFEAIRFSDMTVNLTAKAVAASVPQANVDRMIELYVAFFNRIPDADGLVHWIGQMSSGKSVNTIADTFYGLGVQYSTLTGFTASMSNADFIHRIYKNVLGRSDGADAGGLKFWEGRLTSGEATRGSLVSDILNSAHGFKGDATYGYVANLLDNKISTAKTFALELGLGYVSPDVAISKGMDLAAAVTSAAPADTLKLIGISQTDLLLT